MALLGNANISYFLTCFEELGETKIGHPQVGSRVIYVVWFGEYFEEEFPRKVLLNNSRI